MRLSRKALASERDGHIGKEIAEEFADRLQEAHGRCFTLRIEIGKLIG